MRPPPSLRVAAIALSLGLGGCAHVEPRPAAAVRQSGDAIVFRGQINTRSAAEFLRLVQDPAIRRVVITSYGGLVSAALDMADAIHARGLDVEVPSACHSSCANYIFPAARRKLLGAPDAVAWHGNMAHVLHLEQTGQESWSMEAMASARALARREAQFYRRIGVDGFVAWFGKIPPYGVEDFYYLSLADMERFGIRGVTLRGTARAAPDDPGLQPVTVDWAGLEAIRPALRIPE